MVIFLYPHEDPPVYRYPLSPPGEIKLTALVPFPARRALDVSVARPVPPRATPNVPDVILLASRPGIRAESNVPLVILLASRPGIRAAAKVPLVILLASRSGTLSTRSVPESSRPALK